MPMRLGRQRKVVGKSSRECSGSQQSARISPKNVKLMSPEKWSEVRPVAIQPTTTSQIGPAFYAKLATTNLINGLILGLFFFQQILSFSSTLKKEIAKLDNALA